MPEDRNLADLFAELWLRLREDEPGFRATLHEQEGRRADVLAVAIYLDNILNAQGLDAVTTLEDCLAGRGSVLPDSEMERFALVAQAIDRWHTRLFPIGDQPSSRDIHRARAERTLVKLGRLNNNEHLGKVLPKRPFWGRHSDLDMELPPDVESSPWEAFISLMVAPSEISAEDPDSRGHSRKVQFSYRMLDRTELRDPDPDWVPVIGFAPIAELPDDLDVQVRHADARHWYDARARDLGGRAAACIERLCRAGAHIIVFPEAATHPDALVQIQAAIAAYGPLPSSQLRMVLAGTSPQPCAAGRPFNEAVLFNHRGTEIGRQRKLHRWNLGRELRVRYGLDCADLDASADLFEFITPGEKVLVIEQVQFGRLAVMICEDLSRSEPGRWLRSNMLLDWLFTPILDSSISIYPRPRWMIQKGSEAALGGRCRVIVANSFPFTHRQNTENQKSGGALVDLCGVGLCIDVKGGQDCYHLQQLPLSATPGQSCMVRWDPSTWRKSIDIN